MGPGGGAAIGATGIAADGLINYVVLQSKAGREVIRCKAVIDATGDGDVFTLAGEDYEKTACVPWLWFRMGGVEQPDEAAGITPDDVVETVLLAAKNAR